MAIKYKEIKKENFIIFILLVGFFLRVLFFLWGADILLGNKKYIMGDTFGWTLSFKNLVHHGVYSFDLTNPAASMGRVPGYSFFWGIHYLLFDENAYVAVAITQLMLDILSIYLIFRITLRVTQNYLTANIASCLYATYPFVIGWITVSYSELLSTFLSILFFFLLLKDDISNRRIFLIGALCGAVFLTREFLGILLPIAIFYIFFFGTSSKLTHSVFKSFLVIIGFISIYSWWPLRNLLLHHKLVLARENNAFDLYKEDFQAFRNWITCWDNEEGKWVNEILTTPVDSLDLPVFDHQNPKEVKTIKNIISHAKTCGESFIQWQNKLGIKKSFPDSLCNSQVSSNFKYLSQLYKKKHPLKYYTSVPLKNLRKALFKSNLEDGSVANSNRLLNIIFGYRSLIVILGILGIFFSVQNTKVIPLTIFSILIYLLFCFIIRYIEMRNLLQADVVLLIPAAICITKIFLKFDDSYRTV